MLLSRNNLMKQTDVIAEQILHLNWMLSVKQNP